MKSFIASHRAGLGVVAFVGLLLVPITPSHSSEPWVSVALAVFDVLMWGLVMLGGYALYTSPYMNVLYRELYRDASLRRTTTAVTDLDERERGMRDRAAGFTYHLFAVVNLLFLAGAAFAHDIGWFSVDAEILSDALAPYAYFALGLPVLMLEWFEPSWRHAPIEDEEEA